MKKTTNNLDQVIGDLTRAARAMGLNDTQWAARAGLRKETLSRLRHRGNCNVSTLRALAGVLDMQLHVTRFNAARLTDDGHFPKALYREDEERLLEVCAARTLSPRRWAEAGPGFFMAGVAVMLASVRGFDRTGLLALAEHLHPGTSRPEVFAIWLQRTPLSPSRFLPMLDQMAHDAA